MSKKEVKLTDDTIISKDIRDKADKIKSLMDVDTKKGTITVNGNPFEETLPEGYTIEQYKATQKALGEYGIATQVAFSEAAIDVLKANDNLETVSAKFPIYKHDAVSHTMIRHSEVMNLATNQKQDNYGSTRTKFEISAVTKRTAAAKNVAKFFSAEAADIFS